MTFPRMSATEREALAAGTVWVERELFSGRPHFRRMLRESYPTLSEREQAFLDGPVAEVCRKRAFLLVTRSAAVTERLRAAVRARRLPAEPAVSLYERAVAAGVITTEEAERAREVEAARLDALAVDSFSLEEYLGEPAQEVSAIPAVAGRRA